MVLRQIYVDSNPQRTSRKVPRMLEAAKAKIQIGELKYRYIAMYFECATMFIFWAPVSMLS